MTRLTDEQLASWLAVAKAAGPHEPWQYGKSQETDPDDVARSWRETYDKNPPGPIHIVHVPQGNDEGLYVAITGNGPTSAANAKFIAWCSPDNVATLLEDLCLTRDERDTARRVLAEHRANTPPGGLSEAHRSALEWSVESLRALAERISPGDYAAGLARLLASAAPAPVGAPVAPRIKIKLDAETRPTMLAAKAARREVLEMPTWKRGSLEEPRTVESWAEIIDDGIVIRNDTGDDRKNERNHLAADIRMMLREGIIDDPRAPVAPLTVAAALMLPEVRDGSRWVQYQHDAQDAVMRIESGAVEWNYVTAGLPGDTPFSDHSIVGLLVADLDAVCTLVPIQSVEPASQEKP